MFSVPLNPKLNEAQFKDFISFCKRNKNLIADIYFTSRIPPFNNDAMGDVLDEQDKDIALEQALIVRQETGIPLSATFNNIQVRPDGPNLDLFIKNFKKLYDLNIHIVTIPHTLWMLTGKIQKTYPKLYVKNTILRMVTEANQVVKLAEAGFHYINFHRDLMRDEEQLKRLQDTRPYIKEKYGVDIKFSLLANEGCSGNCPVMPEHFEFNNLRESKEQPNYFNTEIAQVSCPTWEKEDPAYPWRVANFPPWKEEWDRLLTFIDVIKMHGRESIPRLFQTIDIIDRYREGKDILFKEFEEYVKSTHFNEKRVVAWRNKIINCKFDCWECNVCDLIVRKNVIQNMTKQVNSAYEAATKSQSKISHSKTIKGLTSEKVKHFVNNLCELPESSYLELGVYQGAVFSAALENNDGYFTAIDNWKEQLTTMKQTNFDVYNNRDLFLQNIEQLSKGKVVRVLDTNMFKFDVFKIPGTSNILFYDGPHEAEYSGSFLKRYINRLDKQFILVVDDWNWTNVSIPVKKSIKQLNLKVHLQKEVLTKGEDPDDFWNGLGIFVLEKQ